MRTPWLVLVAITLVAAVAPAADAKRATCACPRTIVLPDGGATNVPINTKVWVLDHTGAPESGANSLRMITVPGVDPEGPLAPNTEYSPEGTSFTTGAAADTTPPTRPTGVNLSIIVTAQPTETMRVDAISLWGTFDADTVLVEVKIFDGHRWSTFYTTPRRLYVCLPGISIAPGRVRVSIQAIDLAGNTSAPFETFADVTVGDGPSSDTCGEGPRTYSGHFRCGTGDLALLLLIPVVVIGLLLGLLVVRLIRNARIRRAVPTEVGLLVAEAVVRLMLRGHLIASALGLVAIGISLAVESHGLGFALAVIPFIGLTNALSCKLALGRIDRQGASAERRDTWLIVSDVSGETRVRANERVFQAAKRAALPAASIDPRGDR